METLSLEPWRVNHNLSRVVPCWDSNWSQCRELKLGEGECHQEQIWTLILHILFDRNKTDYVSSADPVLFLLDFGSSETQIRERSLLVVVSGKL